MRPCRALLGVDMPIGVGDCVDAEKAVLAALGAELRSATQQPLAGDAAVDHDMRDMDAERAVFARPALRDRAQPGFGGGELGVSRSAAQICAGAGEQDAAPA